MTGKNSTVQVSKQERMLYGSDWAALVRRLGDAAQAAEDARSLAELALRDSANADGFTGGPRDDQGRSPETARRHAIVERVAVLEQGAVRLFSEIANECVDHRRRWRDDESSTSADADNAPSVVVTASSGIDPARLADSTFSSGGAVPTHTYR